VGWFPGLVLHKILLLRYDGQKPPSPDFHTALAAWVKAGGALVVLDDSKNPMHIAIQSSVAMDPVQNNDV
jgi:hypothetical protein